MALVVMPDEVKRADALLVGIALDVSESMRSSIANATGVAESRFEVFSQALAVSFNRAQRVIRFAGDSAPVSVFAYAFGLRHGSVVDLLTLFKASRDIGQEERRHLDQS